MLLVFIIIFFSENQYNRYNYNNINNNSKIIITNIINI